MAEVPVFLVAVPFPSNIRVGIMTAAVVYLLTGVPTGGKVFPIRRRMGDHSRTITGNGKVSRTEQTKAQGREYGKDRKDFLQGRFGVWGGELYASKELIAYIEYTIHTGYLFRLRSKFNNAIDALPAPEEQYYIPRIRFFKNSIFRRGCLIRRTTARSRESISKLNMIWRSDRTLWLGISASSMMTTGVILFSRAYRLTSLCMSLKRSLFRKPNTALRI